MDNSLVVEGFNIANLTDEELSERLQSLGFNPGPIVATTRSVYQRKLARLMRNENFNEAEDNVLDEDMRPPPLHSTMIHSPSSSSSSPSYRSSPGPSYTGTTYSSSSPSFNYDDLRRRPLIRDPELFSSPPTLEAHKGWSPDDIVTQVTPPPGELEKPLISNTVKIVLLVLFLLFAFFVYFNMESTPVNPFTSVTDSSL